MKELICDVAAGEQGPSCSSVKQIPDVKVIHVRFVEGANEAVSDIKGDDQMSGGKRKRIEFTGPSSNPTQSNEKVSEFVPRSMSLVEVLKLGKEIKETSTIQIILYRFDLEQLAWGRTPYTVEFIMAKDAIGTGEFRKAFKTTGQAKEFKGTTWVVKKYFPEAILDHMSNC